MLRDPWRSIPVALALALLLAPAVEAHAELESATPGPNDEVVGSPPELIARFSQNLDPSRTVLEVRDAAGTQIARGGEPGDGKREFRLALPALPAGEYEVRWTSFSSEDGELARNSYTFTVSASPSPTPSPSPSPSVAPSAMPSASPPPAASTTAPTPGPSAEPAPGATSVSALETAVPIAATTLVVAAVAVWLMRRRRP